VTQSLTAGQTKPAADTKPIKVLLIEDGPGDARLVREMCAEITGVRIELEWVDRLSTGLERLQQGWIDLILLDLSLPDGRGLEMAARLRERAPDVPVIVLTGTFDESLGKDAVRQGVQDYLLKDNVDSRLLERSLLYAMERQRLLAEVRSLSLVDDLTGLHNRRGLLPLAGQQLKIADRTRKPQLLFFADVDDLKSINDAFGHQEGDVALQVVADLLRATFRRADILARIGGDEFAALAIDTSEDSGGPLLTRLQETLDHRNRGNHRYPLSLSVGTALYDPDRPCSLDELLARADEAMYQAKRAKQED